MNTYVSVGALLQVRDILLDIALPDATALHRQIALHMQTCHQLAANQVFDALTQREALGSTALGLGVAIPHARIPGLTRTCLAYLRPQEGLAYGAPDHLPVRDFMAVLVPERASDIHLHLLASIAQRFSDTHFRDALHACHHPEEAWALFRFGLTPTAIIS